jgi:excisionase family DNA binding protein
MRRPIRKHLTTEVPLPPPGRMSVSLEEAAALTGLCVNSIRRAVKDEQLEVHRFGARVIVRRTDLDNFLKALPKGLRSRAGKEEAERERAPARAAAAE